MKNLSPSARRTKSPPPPPSASARRRQRADGKVDGGWEASQPEIRVAYSPVGRETLAAITAEITGEEPQIEDTSRDTPEIQVSEVPAGRETLAAIAEELRPGARAPLKTLPYEDRIKNAPGAHTPSMGPPLPRANSDKVPDSSIEARVASSETRAAATRSPGKEALASSSPASTRNVAASSPDLPSPAPFAEPLEIFEMVTFVVRGPDAARLSTDALRRRFVEERLMHRLPISSPEEIDRVDVTPWTVHGTFVVRVWCKVAGIETVDVHADEPHEMS